jgi:hypothetical protein
MSDDYIKPVDHDKRMRAAEAVAQWYLADRGWAGKILGAYMYPDESMEDLRRERRETA